MLVKNQYYESTISIELMALQKYSRFKPLPFPKRYHPKERHAPFHGSKGNKLHEAESQKMQLHFSVLALFPMLFVVMNAERNYRWKTDL